MAGLMKRDGIYYAIYRTNGKEHRKSLETDDPKLAKAKLRKLEDALDMGVDSPFPTKTPLPHILEEYATYLYSVKRDRNADKIIACLRHLFGPICPPLEIRNEKISIKADRLKATRPLPFLEAHYLEELTTADIARVIEARVKRKGIKGKTANRYREILVRLINWSIGQRGVRMPQGRNPAAAVERYKEGKMNIVYLTLEEIGEQLSALAEYHQLQTIVAVYILAGLRREEALWLTTGDLDLTVGNHGIIHVRAKTINGESWVPKTGEDRIVPVSGMLRFYLDRYKAPSSDADWLFPSPRGMRWDPDNFSDRLRAVNTKHGLRWGCDEYRHTFGSHLAMKGESLFKISKIMGNSEEICRRHYVSLMPESLYQSVDFMDQGLEPVGKAKGILTEDREEKRGRVKLRLIKNT